jgi:uncharacterized protein with PIN domain
MKFIADAMLGRLAKWMRIAGYDVEYFPRIGDAEIAERGLREGRVILTRDRLLIRRKAVRDNHFFVRGDRYRVQFLQVVRHYPVDIAGQMFTRCLRCNTLLVPVPRSSLRQKVPDYVFATQETFQTCSSCRRVYWGATHRESMVRELTRMIPDFTEPPGIPPVE